jgi:hypothetical protein
MVARRTRVNVIEARLVGAIYPVTGQSEISLLKLWGRKPSATPAPREATLGAAQGGGRAIHSRFRRRVENVTILLILAP